MNYCYSFIILFLLGLSTRPVKSGVIDPLTFSFSYYGSFFTFISIHQDGYVLLNDTSGNEIRISVQPLGLTAQLNYGPINSTDELKNCSNIISAQFSVNNSFKFAPVIGYKVIWSLSNTFSGRLVLITDFFYSFFIMTVNSNQLASQSRFIYSGNQTNNFTAAIGQPYAFQSSQKQIGENYTVQCSKSYIIASTTTTICNVLVSNTNLNYFNLVLIGYSFCMQNSTLSQDLTSLNQSLSFQFEISCDTTGSQLLILQNLNTGYMVSQTTITVYPAVSVISECSNGLNFVNQTGYSCLIILSNDGPSLNGTLSYQFCSTSESASITSLSRTQGMRMQIYLTCNVPGYQNLQIQLNSNIYNKTVYQQTLYVQSVNTNFLSYGSSSEAFLSASAAPDYCQANISLGFTFTYFSNSYTTISVCTNGYILMGNTLEGVYLNQGGQYSLNTSSGSVSYFANISSSTLLTQLGSYASSYYKPSSGFQITPTNGFLATWNEVSTSQNSSLKLNGQIFLVTDGSFSFFGVVFGQIDAYTFSDFIYNYPSNLVYSFSGSSNSSNVNLTGYYIFKASGQEESYSVSCDRKYYIITQPISCHLTISNVNIDYFTAENILYSIGGKTYTIQRLNTDNEDTISTAPKNQFDITDTSLIPGINQLLFLNDNLYFNNTIWSQTLMFYPNVSLVCNYPGFNLTTLADLICQIGAVSNPNGLIADLSICYGDNSNCTYGPLSLIPFTMTKKYSKPGVFVLTVSSPQPDGSVLYFLSQNVSVSLKIAYSLTCNQSIVVVNTTLICNISLFYMGQINLTFVSSVQTENISTPVASEMISWSTLRNLVVPSVQGNYTFMLLGSQGEMVSSFNLLVIPMIIEIIKTTKAFPLITHEEPGTIRLTPVILPPKPTTIKTDMPFGNSALMLGLLSSYTGDLSDCLINCTNNGDCVYNTTTQLYLCSCFSYYSGSGCKTSLDPCYSSPCLNNGTCSVYAVDNDFNNLVYECDCGDSLYYGTNCQNQIDLCANVTCSGKGNCKVNSTTNEAYCECLYLYTGENCQTESSQMKVVKNVVTTTSVIAIVIISSLYLLAAVLDLLKVLGCNVIATPKPA